MKALCCLRGEEGLFTIERATARPAFWATFQCSMRTGEPVSDAAPGPWYVYVAMSPIAYTSPFRAGMANVSSVRIEPSCSREMAGLFAKKSVAGLTPMPKMTTSACKVVPSLRCTAPTLPGLEDEGVALSTFALR